MSSASYPVHNAVQDFQAARQRASIQEVLARVLGKSNELLSYDEVAEKLNLHARVQRGVQNIPIDSIVGSVGRYTDFTRTFLPRHDSDRDRWVQVKVAMEDGVGWPAIEVYKVGDAYFVVDGNHRVSIARREGFKTIEARVTEFNTDFKLTPDTRPDDLIIETEYVDFLNQTRIRESRPNVDLLVTSCRQYEKMLDEIRICQGLLQEEHKRDVSFQDAAGYWYEAKYIPLAEAIRDRGLLRWFPKRTITDLYIWISENRSRLEKESGWEIQSDIAATDLILERNARDESGSWRKARTVTRYTDTLFTDILVPLSGDPESWDSLHQAILMARRENARLHGLHIVDSKEKVESPDALTVQIQFDQICADAGVDGSLVIESGGIAKKICERATMTDLIVLKIVHPPMGGLATLKSPFRAIITNSSRPILGVPSKATQFQRALLSYDGSERAKEALFVATYLAEMWKTELIVFTSIEGGKIKPDIQDYVKRYLDIHEVQADYTVTEQDSKVSLLKTVEERHADLVLMGGYGGSVIREVVIGSSLDTMLRESKVPTFICR
jgi:nucleotide-binding universal stress UspA family protein